MAIDNTVAMWNENAGTVYNAREYRRFLEKLMGFDVVATPGTGSGGVFRSADLVVSAGGGQSVNVAAGAGFVDGSESSTQGGYFIYNDATVNVVLSAANATNPRKDLIGLQVRDSEYSGVTNDARILVITGTPAASPAEPAAPANFVTLALVDVPANDNTVDSGQITNRRRWMSALGGIVICTSTTRPSVNLAEGMWCYEQDTHKLMQYTTGTTLWTPPWNLPWGYLNGAQRTTNQTGITTQVDLTSMSVAVTLVANRRLKIAGSTAYTKDATPAQCNLYIAEGATVYMTTPKTMVASETQPLWAEIPITPTAGAHTYKLQGLSGSGALDSLGNAVYPTWMSVEDIGFAGAPA